MTKNVKKTNMNTMFRAVITLANGMHKTIRVARWQVAHIVAKFHEYTEDIFKRIHKVDVNDETIVFNDCTQIKFVYESTRDEYLTLA